MPRLARVVALTLPLLALNACMKEFVPVGTVSLRQEQTDPIRVLGVALDRGQVAIVHAAGSALEVEAEVRVVEERAGEFEGASLRFEDHVAVEVRDGHQLFFRSAHEGDVDGDDWELRITVRVPSDPELRLKIDAGSIAVRLPVAKGVSADLDAGQIDLEIGRIEGATSVKVDAGQIRLAASEAIGDVDLDVDAGQIELALPGSFAGAIDAAVDVGEVDSAPRLGLTPKRDVVSKSVRGVVGQGGETKVKLRVDAGQIDIR